MFGVINSNHIFGLGDFCDKLPSQNVITNTNKYSLQEISTSLETVWIVVFSQLHTPGSCIFLGKTQPAFTCSKLTIEKLEQRCEICSKLTIKPPKRHHWRRFGSFIVNFEHISHLCPSFSVVNFEQVITGWAFYFHILVLDYVLLIRFVFVYNFVLHHSPICWTSKLRLLNSRCYLISCVLSASDIVLGIAWEIIKLQYPLVTFL